MENNKLDGMSMDIEQEARERLQSVFPDCFSDGKLDIDKLLTVCGEYITNDFEKYRFEWRGKSECLQLAQKRSAGTLRPKMDESVNWDTTQNVYIKGDNLEVLKLLQTAYFRKVKMIYIDPPYNTGNDFVYADDFADPISRYKEVTEQTTKSNPETMGRFHTNWLNMMYPRLRLAANLLRDDGVCFISIDDNEVDNLKKLCNETFGEENFVAQIIWQKRTSPDARKKISAGHEYILLYVKDGHYFDDALNLLSLSEKDTANFKNPDNDPRGAWVSSDFTAQGFRPNQVYKIVTPGGAEYTPAAGRCWKNVESVYLQQVKEGRMWFGSDGKGVPRRKTYLAERDGKNVWTWWPNSEVGHTQEATQEVKKLFGEDAPIFDFPKPTRLIKRMVEMASNPNSNDIILDFFSGSATTAHAVMQLNAEDGGNRQFICVQLPEVCDEKSEAYKAGYHTICDIGIERIRRAGTKILSERSDQLKLGEAEKPPLDIGFKVFELDTSNMNLWDSSYVSTDQAQLLFDRMNDMIENVKPDRTEIEVVYEIMLKMGLPLTYPILPIEVNGKKMWSIGEDCMLLVCLARHITPEDVTEMCAFAPAKLVMADFCFDDTTAMANANYILKRHHVPLKLL